MSSEGFPYTKGREDLFLEELDQHHFDLERVDAAFAEAAEKVRSLTSNADLRRAVLTRFSGSRRTETMSAPLMALVIIDLAEQLEREKAEVLVNPSEGWSVPVARRLVKAAHFSNQAIWHPGGPPSYHCDYYRPDKLGEPTRWYEDVTPDISMWGKADHVEHFLIGNDYHFNLAGGSLPKFQRMASTAVEHILGVALPEPIDAALRSFEKGEQVLSEVTEGGHVVKLFIRDRVYWTDPWVGIVNLSIFAPRFANEA